MLIGLNGNFHYAWDDSSKTRAVDCFDTVFILERFKQDLESREFGENEEDEKEELEDTAKKCEADIARSWGKYTLVLLQTSMDAFLEEESGLAPTIGSHNQEEVASMQVQDIELCANIKEEDTHKSGSRDVAKW